jgi:eukaryotic-like serine/threonine-protein kinase
MGIVYLAMARGPGGFNKLVVVKELKPELVEEPAFLTMFLDEARLAARLSHPNIVQTNEVGSDGHRYFMAMDYLDGRSLDRARKRSNSSVSWQLTLPLHLRIICDVLSGLDYAHRLADFDGTPLHLVHRDISPSNVFLTFDGQVKLLDFGIAKTTDSSQETRAGVLKGKLSYMAPEQARGERVDARADIFAVGVLLWEALTGRRLRNANNEYEILQSLVIAQQPLASSVNPDVPPELDEICARAIATDREHRYPSAAAFRNELEHFMSKAGVVATSRELGAVLSEMFREDRASTNQLVEAHIARARSGSDALDLPIIPTAPPIGLSGFTPSREHVPTQLGTPPPPLPSQSTLPQNELSSAAPSGPHLSPPPQQGRSRLLIPTVAISVIAIASFIYVAFLMPSGVHPGGDPTLAATVPAAAASPGAPAGDPDDAPIPVAGAPRGLVETNRPAGQHDPSGAAIAGTVVRTPDEDLVEIEIRVTPEDATVTIDGAVVPGNPFRGKFVRGDAIRRIRASAPGFNPKIHAVSFDANVKLDFSLERKPQRQVQAAAKPARNPPQRPPEPPRAVEPPPPAPAPELNPAGGTKPRRPIDPSNPYGGAE